VLPDAFQGMGARRNSMETQQSGHAPKSRSVVKTGKSRAKARGSDAVPSR